MFSRNFLSPPERQPVSRDASRKALADLRDGDEENAESSDPTWVPLADIRVPHAFLRTRTNPQKTVELQAWVRAYGVLDQPLVVTRRGGRYVVAKEEGLSEIPVVLRNG